MGENTVDEKKIQIVKHARNSFLYTNKTGCKNENTPWCKKSGKFDVTMGAPDGAEVCEIVGLMLLNEINTTFPEMNFGLYRDDGLASHGHIPGPKLDRIRKDLHSLFEKHGLKITIDTKLHSVHFLDVTLDLQKESYAPYKKPNDTTLYIHKDSNHPPAIIKQVPKIINDRLNNISSNEEVFKEASNTYQKALDQSGYKHTLKYEKKTNNNGTEQSPSRPKKKPKRDVVWFNPPFNKNVKTNVGKCFLKLIDKHFPQGHKLRKVINRNCVKISYSCMPNIRTIIQTHNARILQEVPEGAANEQNNKTCNCRNKNNCPLSGECKTGPIVYMAKIKNNNKEIMYIGSTQDFKERLANHKASFRHDHLKKETVLSQYVWREGLNPEPEISWTILKKGTIYRKGTRYCDICLSEKMFIAKYEKHPDCLNKRTDFTSKCLHKNRYKLSRLK